MNLKLKFAGVALASVLATVAVGGIAASRLDHRFGPIGHADANADGQITSAEWMKAAATRFARLDANHDGKLVVGEVPPPPPSHHHGPHDFDRDDGPERDDASAAAPAVTPTTNLAAPATTAP